MENVDYSFADLARSKSIGPIVFGKNINELGDLLGPPQYWGFGPGERFSMVGTYADVEIHCHAVDNVVKVFYAELRLSRFKRRRTYLVKNRKSQVTVSAPQRPSKLTLDYLSKYFDGEGLSYFTYPSEVVSPSTTGTLRFDENLCFYFSGEPEPLLELISLS